MICPATTTKPIRSNDSHIFYFRFYYFFFLVRWNVPKYYMNEYNDYQSTCMNIRKHYVFCKLNEYWMCLRGIANARVFLHWDFPIVAEPPKGDEVIRRTILYMNYIFTRRARHGIVCSQNIDRYHPFWLPNPITNINEAKGWIWRINDVVLCDSHKLASCICHGLTAYSSAEHKSHRWMYTIPFIYYSNDFILEFSFWLDILIYGCLFQMNLFMDLDLHGNSIGTECVKI